MRKINMCKCVTACVLALLLACPFTAMAQQAVNVEWWAPTNQVFRPEELDQILAPIALYPDALLAQALAAATYPQSIAAADRFVKDNPRVPGQVLIDVARDTDWSPSVKAMLLFPDVLAMMNQHLDWTTKLGDAFLTQQGDVMDSVQRLRQMAYQQGRLMTTREAVVRFDQRTQTIFIEPANSQMVYVPVYDPEIVYGTWRYPNYPPYRYYYPGYSNSSAFSFLAGILVGAGLGWGGWDFDWQHHRSNVRVSNYNNFVRRSYSSPDRFQISSTGGEIIVYDTQFRKNAGYKDYTTAQNAGRQQAAGPAATRVNTSGVRGSSQIQTRSSAPTVSAASVNAPRRDTAPRTTSNYPVNATAARTEIPPASKTKSKGNVITPRPAAKAGRPTQNPSAGVSNAGPVSQKSSAGPASQGSSEVSKGSGSQGNIKPTDKKAAKSDSGKAADKKASNQDGSQDDSKPSGKAVINTDNSQDDNKSADKTVTKPDNSKGDKEKRR